MAPEKNPHAVILGRKGGRARNAALSPAEKSRIAHLGGRPPTYRLTASGDLEKRVSDHWITLEAPYDEPAKAFLRRCR